MSGWIEWFFFFVLIFCWPEKFYCLACQSDFGVGGLSTLKIQLPTFPLLSLCIFALSDILRS